MITTVSLPYEIKTESVPTAVENKLKAKFGKSV